MRGVIKILVILLVLLTGVGLMVSFVSRVRKAAEILKCQDNLRQIGAACQAQAAYRR